MCVCLWNRSMYVFACVGTCVCRPETDTGINLCHSPSHVYQGRVLHLNAQLPTAGIPCLCHLCTEFLFGCPACTASPWVLEVDLWSPRSAASLSEMSPKFPIPLFIGMGIHPDVWFSEELRIKHSPVYVIGKHSTDLVMSPAQCPILTLRIYHPVPAKQWDSLCETV